MLKAANNQLPGFERQGNQEWDGPFFFVQAADTQIGLMSQRVYTEDGESYKNKDFPATDITWDEEIKIIHKFVKEVNAMEPKPAFVIVCGDMVDAKPNKLPELKRAQDADFKRAFEDIQVPLVCVCGNHEIGDQPKAEYVIDYRKNYGDDYFAFWKGGVHFIVINSQFYMDGSQVQEMVREQDEWLEKELAKPAVHKVVFQHIPWFQHHPNHVSTHSIPLETRKRMLDKLTQAGVKKVFCGHTHFHGQAWYGDMEMVITGALGDGTWKHKHAIGNNQRANHDFRIVTIENKDEITHKIHSVGNISLEHDPKRMTGN